MDFLAKNRSFLLTCMHVCDILCVMKTEAEFKSLFKDANREQLIDALYQLQLKYEHLEEVNANLSRMHFARKSEHVHPDQLSLFNEAEETAEDASKKELEEQEITVPSYTRKKKKKRSMKDLPVEIMGEMRPASTICPECGSEMKELAPKNHDYLVYVPSKLYVQRWIEHVYACDKCSKEKDSLVTVEADTSNLPARLFEGSIITSSVVAHIAYEKMVMCVPLYRQEKNYRYNNAYFSRQNLSNWFIKGAKDYLQYVFHRMEKDFSTLEVANGDETPLTCLENQDERENSYVWLLMSGIHEASQMALYYYHDNRKHEFLDEIIPSDWGGIFHSDGYEAYQKCQGIHLLCGCWAHARRKVFEAMTSDTKTWKKYNSKKTTKAEKQEILNNAPRLRFSLQLISEIDKLFLIEKELKDQSASVEDTFNVRQEKAPEILKNINDQCTMIQNNFVPSSKLVEAANYIMNQWEYLNNYIKDGRCEISNNLAEREGIKPFVMARKNFLFSATRDGAKYTCMYFSIIISAVMNHLNPEAYLTYVFDELSTHGLRDDVIERVLPYSKSLPENLKVKY